jgi:hypothetical protein
MKTQLYRVTVDDPLAEQPRSAVVPMHLVPSTLKHLLEGADEILAPSVSVELIPHVILGVDDIAEEPEAPAQVYVYPCEDRDFPEHVEFDANVIQSSYLLVPREEAVKAARDGGILSPQLCATAAQTIAMWLNRYGVHAWVAGPAIG